MHFEVEHEFPAGPARVVEVLCDPAFHQRLDLPDLSRLNGAATIAITALDDGQCRRRISGDLHVRPLVGSTAERRIGPGLVRRLDAEAAALMLVLTASP